MSDTDMADTTPTDPPNPEKPPAPPSPPPGDDPLKDVAAEVAERAPTVDSSLLEQQQAEEQRRKMKEEAKAVQKVGRSKVSTTTAAERKKDEEAQKDKDNVLLLSEYRRSGREFIDSLILTLGTFSGPKWYYRKGEKVRGPDGEMTELDERSYMREAYADFFEAHHWKTPKGTWLQVITASACFAVRRVETDSAKIDAAKGAVGGWFKGLLRRIFSKKEKPADPPPPSSAVGLN